MGIFIDSGFYMGLVNPKDKYFDKSLELLNVLKTGKYGQIYTSNLVMSEASTLVNIRTNKNTIALNAIWKLFNGNEKFSLILRSNEIIERKIWNIFLKVNSQKETKSPMSYVDCSNIVFCEEHVIDHILSYDQHFDGWLSRIH